MYQLPKYPFHTFCKRLSFIWGCVFPVSILKQSLLDLGNTLKIDKHFFQWVQCLSISSKVHINVCGLNSCNWPFQERFYLFSIHAICNLLFWKICKTYFKLSLGYCISEHVLHFIRPKIIILQKMTSSFMKLYSARSRFYYRNLCVLDVRVYSILKKLIISEAFTATEILKWLILTFVLLSKIISEWSGWAKF